MSATVVELSPTTLDALATRIVQCQRAATPANPYVLTRAEAKAYVGKASDDAFAAWCKTYKIKPCGHGRYAKRHIDRALELEARVRA